MQRHIHVNRKPEHVVHDTCDGHTTDGTYPSSTSSMTSSPAATASTSASVLEITTPAGGTRISAAGVIDDPAKPGVRSTPVTAR